MRVGCRALSVVFVVFNRVEGLGFIVFEVSRVFERVEEAQGVGGYDYFWMLVFGGCKALGLISVVSNDVQSTGAHT